MFDRATSQSWQLGSAPVASVATLASLAAVLNDTLAARDKPSELRDPGAASDSRRRFREKAMPRRSTLQQLDLFDPPSGRERFATPQWRSLPDAARLTLTALMTRLILDHADGGAAEGGRT